MKMILKSDERPQKLSVNRVFHIFSNFSAGEKGT